MATTEQTLKTGIQGLDRDLAAYFAFADATDFEKLAGQLKSIGQDDLDETVRLLPDAVYNILFNLINPTFFDSLLDRASDEGKEALRKAKEIADIRFMPLMEIPAIKQLAQEYVVALSSAQEKAIGTSPADRFNTITRVQSLRAWVGEPPELLPTLRMTFYGPGQTLLLDSTGDLDDWTFLTRAVLRRIVGLARGAAVLQKEKSITIRKMKHEKVLQRLDEIAQDASEAKRLLHDL